MKLSQRMRWSGEPGILDGWYSRAMGVSVGLGELAGSVIDLGAAASGYSSCVCELSDASQGNGGGGNGNGGGSEFGDGSDPSGWNDPNADPTTLLYDCVLFSSWAGGENDGAWYLNPYVQVGPSAPWWSASADYHIELVGPRWFVMDVNIQPQNTIYWGQPFDVWSWGYEGIQPIGQHVYRFDDFTDGGRFALHLGDITGASVRICAAVPSLL